MKIKICQYIAGDFYATSDNWFRKYAEPINRLYCDTHGYEYILDDYTTGAWQEDWEDRNAYWLMVPCIQRNLKDCDYLYFMDADQVAYNHLFKIEEDLLEMMTEVDASIMVNIDVCGERERYHPDGIAAGQMLLKNDDIAHAFLRKWWDLANEPELEKRKTTWPNEQEVLRHVCQKVPDFKPHIKVVLEYYKMTGRWGYFFRHVNSAHNRESIFEKMYNSPLMERNRKLNGRLDWLEHNEKKIL